MDEQLEEYLDREFGPDHGSPVDRTNFLTQRVKDLAIPAEVVTVPRDMGVFLHFASGKDFERWLNSMEDRTPQPSPQIHQDTSLF